MKIISRRARPHTITLYNYLSTSAGAAAYQRTVIERVCLDEAYQQRLGQRGVTTSDTAQLIIDLRDIKTTSDRTFLPLQDWMQLTAAEKAAYFTFSSSNDFFVAGPASEELPPETKKDMISRHQCLSVTGAAIPASDKSGPVIVEVTAK